MTPVGHDSAVERLDKIRAARKRANEKKEARDNARAAYEVAKLEFRKALGEWEILASEDGDMPLFFPGEKSPPAAPAPPAAEGNGHSRTSLPIARLVPVPTARLEPRQWRPIEMKVLNLSPKTEQALLAGGYRDPRDLEQLANVDTKERNAAFKRMGITPIQGKAILKLYSVWKSRQDIVDRIPKGGPA
jgi:hypothetical protein